MKIVECKQYTPEWWDARRGIPTCSQFHRIITPVTEKLSSGADDYIHELIGQRICHTPEFFTDRPTTRDMEHGSAIEPEARRAYEFFRAVEVKEVGFVLHDSKRYGGSPDGLVGDDGGLELKCPQMKTHVKYLIEQKLPDEYKAQVHGLLIVTGRPWWDFMSYVGPSVDPFIIRVEPNGFTRNLRICLEQFLEKLDKTIAKLKGPKP